jgi:hypothetical protein
MIERMLLVCCPLLYADNPIQFSTLKNSAVVKTKQRASRGKGSGFFEPLGSAGSVVWMVQTAYLGPMARFDGLILLYDVTFVDDRLERCIACGVCVCRKVVGDRCDFTSKSRAFVFRSCHRRRADGNMAGGIGWYDTILDSLTLWTPSCWRSQARRHVLGSRHDSKSPVAAPLTCLLTCLRPVLTTLTFQPVLLLMDALCSITINLFIGYLEKQLIASRTAPGLTRLDVTSVLVRHVFVDRVFLVSQLYVFVCVLCLLSLAPRKGLSTVQRKR